MARSASPSSARRSSTGRPLGVVADGIVVGHRARGQLLAEVLFEADGTGTDPAAAPTEHPHLPSGKPSLRRTMVTLLGVVGKGYLTNPQTKIAIWEESAALSAADSSEFVITR